MDSFLLAALVGVPAMVILTLGFIYARKRINAEHREHKRKVKAEKAKLFLQYSNLRDEISK